MATIYPFQPIRPNPLYADQLVFTKPQAESVSGDHILPLKTLLETPARLRPETPEGQAEAYREIHANLETLLKNEQLCRETLPGIFIYEAVHQDYRQTGIWALTDLTDYSSGRIKIHELTFGDSVRRMKNYREHTGLEGSPVLLTYPPDQTINRLIAGIKATQPKTAFGNPHGLHRLWKVREPAVLQQLTEAFAGIPVAYLADGHHRLESAASSPFPHISSLYMAFDQLRIEPYDRVVVPAEPVDQETFLTCLKSHFYIREATANTPVRPDHPGNFGLCLEGGWYHLRAKEQAEIPDVALLQEQVLAPFFGITDPRADSRLQCAGGEKALEEIGALLGAHPGAIAFTLCPLTVDDLVRAADAGQVLPPKSTWIVPKVPYGLLINENR
jgi:uncharacterized protein (DUF1015 family)